MKKIILMLVIAGSFTACNNKYKNAQSEAAATSVKLIKDSLRIDSFKRAEETKKAAVVTEKTTVINRQSSNSGGTTTQTTTTVHRKGWSAGAKGAVIGGAAGAIGGALIDKKSGRGAIIGGVAGAGAGYLIGHEKDKKTGRAN